MSEGDHVEKYHRKIGNYRCGGTEISGIYSYLTPNCTMTEFGKLKMTLKFLLTVAAVAFPCMAIAADSKTPIMDRETNIVKELLWKKGMSTAPTEMYLAARSQLRTEMCGADADDDTVKMYLKLASVEAPMSVVEIWTAAFKAKMKGVLINNPNEAKAFCQ